jgi:outer membrane protein assembly factor BamC
MHRFLLTTVAAAAVLSGCSWFSSDSSSVDYKSAGTLPPLEVPPDLTSPQRDNRYAVPETARSSATLSGYEAERRDPAHGARAATATPSAAPVVLPVLDSMRIERAGTQRWLVVQEAPEKLWPVVKAFWQENGFLIKVEKPEAGVMETDWAETRARVQDGTVRDFLGKVFDYFHSTAERDKYRTRLDRTADGATEIYISHRGMQELYTTRDPRGETPGATAWQPRPPDPELEAEFLRRLMVRLGAPGERAQQLAAGGEQQMRAEIVKANDGTERLQVHEPFDRAWRRVGLALDRVGFTVEDRDRQKGLYFVRYADPESEMNQKEEGFLARWFSFGNDSKVKAAQYRVQVSAETSGSQVYVLNKDGTAESSKTAQRILALLHEQLK